MKTASDIPSVSCPVCRNKAPKRFVTVGEREYWSCSICEARFLDPAQKPQSKQEYAHYLLHENDPDDPRYRKFLSRLCGPLLEALDGSLLGLDYGCGPGPALAMMLQEAGHSVEIYDPYFFPDAKLLERTYDFITCTEVVEHFHNPAGQFEKLDAMLRPGAWLAIMTCFQTDDARFADWHYRKDPTHVVFYRESTMRWLAENRGWSCKIPIKDVALMRKPG